MRHHLTRPRAAAAAVLASVLLAATGCGNEPGSDGSSSGQVQKLDDSSKSSDDASTTTDPKDIFSASYRAAMKAGSAHVSMKGSGAQSLSAEGDVSYAQSTPSMAMEMTAPGGSGKIEMRLVGGKVYMQIPGMTPQGKYVAFDPTDKTSPFAKSFGTMTSQMDPLKSLTQMEKAVKSVEKVGEEKVDGTDTEHYKVVVDTAVLMKQLGQTSTVSGMPKTLAYDVWVDGKDLMRRVDVDIAGMTMQMRFSKWGEPVTVRKPDASSLVKLPTS